MSLIAKKHVTDREAASYKLDRTTVELVKLYAEFIGSPQEHVVNQALLFVFHKDKEFDAWLKANNKPLPLQKTRPSGTTNAMSRDVALGNGKKGSSA